MLYPDNDVCKSVGFYRFLQSLFPLELCCRKSTWKTLAGGAAWMYGLYARSHESSDSLAPARQQGWSWDPNHWLIGSTADLCHERVPSFATNSLLLAHLRWRDTRGSTW